MVYRKAGNDRAFKFAEFKFKFGIFVVLTMLKRNFSNWGYSKLQVTQPDMKWRSFDQSLHDTTVFWPMSDIWRFTVSPVAVSFTFSKSSVCLVGVTDFCIVRRQ